MSFFDVFSGAPYGSDFLILTKEIIKKVPKRSAKKYKLLKLGKSKDILKYICLSFMSFLPLFYLCYIYYFGLLIFCCQNVAMIESILTLLINQVLLSHL